MHSREEADFAKFESAAEEIWTDKNEDYKECFWWHNDELLKLEKKGTLAEEIEKLLATKE